MAQELHLSDRRELFVDRLLIERMDNCSLKLHEPISGGVAIALDRPWEGPANFGASVMRDDDRYLLYYRAMKLEDYEGVLCVATSPDGSVWEKPALGTVVRGGRRDTNIVAADSGYTGFEYYSAPWLDTRPGVPADERIKALTSEPLSGEKHTAFLDPAGPKRLVPWASNDGFTFRRLAGRPGEAGHPGIVSNLRNCFDGGNTAFWSEAEGRYVLYYRFYDGEWGSGYRTMARATSPDFRNWTEPEPMTYGETPREQFYVNNTVPYFRAPHLYVAPAARFMEGRRVLSDEQAAAIDLKTSHGGSYAGDCSDGVLLTSRAGSTQYDRTFMEAFVRPGLGAANWVSRTNYPLTGILPCGPHHMAIFVNRHYMQDSWHIERLLLRLDGFASVNAPWAGGELLTVPFTFTGKELEINYRTGAAGSIRLEIQDAHGIPLAGYALDDCPEIIGDEIERTIAWRRGRAVDALAGRPVRLRFLLKDADLFSLRFRDE